MGDIINSIDKQTKVEESLVSAIKTLVSRMTGSAGRIAGGVPSAGSGGSVMPTSFGNMSAPELLASSRAANLGYNSLIGIAQMGKGLIGGAAMMMPNMQASLSRGAGFYNAGVFAGTNYQGLATNTMSMMRGGISEIGGDAQTANTLIGMGINPTGTGVNAGQYKNLVTSTANAAKYLNMGNQQASAALGGLTQGGTSQSLMRNFGVWTTDPVTGKRQSATQIFSQMYNRITAGQKLSRSDLETSLQGGALAVDIQNSGLTQDQQNLFTQYTLDRASGKNMDLGNQKAMDAMFKGQAGKNGTGENPYSSQYKMNSATTGALNDSLQPFITGMKNAVPMFEKLEQTSGALAKQFGSLSAYIQTLASSGPGQGAAYAAGGVASGLTSIGGAMVTNAALSRMMGGKTDTGAGRGWFGKGSVKPGGRFGTRPSGVGKVGAAGAAVMGGLTLANDAMNGQGWGSKKFSTDAGSTVGGIAGSIAGSFLDPVLGPFGTILGGMAGAAIGGAIGGMFGGGETSTIQTGTSTDTKKSFKLARPVSAKVTLGYGVVDENHATGHHGIDFGCGPNTPVQAAADGVANAPYYSTEIGNVVEIDHGNGYTSLYAHLTSAGVRAGDAVKQGQVIAASGNTGNNTTGPHLHLGLKGPNGITDPTPFLVGGVAVNGGQTSIGSSGDAAKAGYGSADSAGGLGYSNDYNAPKAAGGIPQSYSGAAIAKGAASSAGSLGRSDSVLGGAQGSMSTGTSNSYKGGGDAPVKSNNFNITVNIAQASESEARKFAQMIKGYIEQETLTNNMGRL
jgi:murein DD-endopeptidase MepM/ murein hydrolase activator NlpD